MSTIDQIYAAHSKVKSGADFPKFIQELIVIGVKSYDSFVADGHTDYFGLDNFKLSSSAKYELLNISNSISKTQFILDLKAHQNGQTDYPTFCNDCAKSGVFKWTVNLTEMICTYFDSAGNELLVEKIPLIE
jgi:uncharacterized protein YbcV (DUF1398 family)